MDAHGAASGSLDSTQGTGTRRAIPRAAAATASKYRSPTLSMKPRAIGPGLSGHSTTLPSEHRVPPGAKRITRSSSFGRWAVPRSRGAASSACGSLPRLKLRVRKRPGTTRRERCREFPRSRPWQRRVCRSLSPGCCYKRPCRSGRCLRNRRFCRCPALG